MGAAGPEPGQGPVLARDLQSPVRRPIDSSCELIREERLNVHIRTFPACQAGRRGEKGVGWIFKVQQGEKGYIKEGGGEGQVMVEFVNNGDSADCKSLNRI